MDNLERRQALLEIERLGTLALLPGLQALEQIAHLVLVEAREGEVEIGRRLELGEQAGEELLVPRPRDLVQREPEESGLLRADVQPDDRDGSQSEPSCGKQPLVPPMRPSRRSTRNPLRDSPAGVSVTRARDQE